MSIYKSERSVLSKFISAITILSLVAVLVAPAKIAVAASLTTLYDVQSRMEASTASDHTIYFKTPSGVASGGTITYTFSAGFTGIGSMVGADFDLAVATTNAACTSASYTEQSVVTSSPSTSQFSIAGSGQVVTVTSGGASATIAADRCVRLKAGLNATDTTGSGPGTHQITNGAIGSTDTITIAGSFGDTGSITEDIIDSDQVSITADVGQSLTFDLDTASDFHNGESSAPYSVALGTLTTGSVTHSDDTAIRMIVAEGDTSASGGMVVTVRNTNGASGLVSTGTPADTIPSATATMAAGTANYGLCVASSGLTGFSRATAYNTSCALASGTNAVVGLTSTPADILNSAGAPVTSAHAEIVVNAAISTATPAHPDYTDRLTFIATGTF